MLEVSAVSSKLIFVKFENYCLILTLVIGQLSVSLLLLLVLLLCPWFCLHSRASICLCSNLVLIFCIVCSPWSSNLSNAAFNQVFFVVFVTCSARVTLWTSGLALDICTFHLVYVWNEIWQCSARVTLWTSGLALEIRTFHLVYVWNEIWQCLHLCFFSWGAIPWQYLLWVPTFSLLNIISIENTSASVFTDSLMMFS